jgi:hypothetical protein
VTELYEHSMCECSATELRGLVRARDVAGGVFDRMRCVMWVNCLSLPGVPLGTDVQLVGRRFQDREVLAAARTARAALGAVSVA